MFIIYKCKNTKNINFSFELFGYIKKKAVILHPVTDKKCKNVSFMADKYNKNLYFIADKLQNKLSFMVDR